MLGFFDESGDPGLKTDAGSSRYFVVALVTFSENDKALACDQKINDLRKELHLPNGFEFHFSVNSKRVRTAFLNSVQEVEFGYHCYVFDKARGVTNHSPFNSPETLYSYASISLFENAAPHLEEISVIMDRNGYRGFRASLLRQLRGSANRVSGSRIITKIKQQDSHRNNLLQLADYVASVTNQAVSGKSDSQQLLDWYLKRREITSGIWPK